MSKSDLVGVLSLFAAVGLFFFAFMGPRALRGQTGLLTCAGSIALLAAAVASGALRK
ncbi:MAG TPA: hypothetical protein VM389_10295 [Phycisphaerae bacterium]|nr:hypothetical protein [Phycisphaerae bacterium]HUU22912.1 hypothetical protein [Phycisphaerae bacterium]